MQNLYEKKLCTYPRTDSQYLPEGMIPGAAAVLEAVAAVLPLGGRLPPVHAIAQVVNDAKVTDHHAILPTVGIRGYALDSLPSGEHTVLRLIIVRLLCAVGAPHVFEETKLLLSSEHIDFTAQGRRTLQDGWRAIHRLFHPDMKPGDADAPALPLPEVREGEALPSASASVRAGNTSPPKHFTEDSLLSAMERTVDTDAPDDAENGAPARARRSGACEEKEGHRHGADARQQEGGAACDLARRGLGTPATRAATIEKLVSAGYMERKGGKKAKHLLPTRKGISLIAVAPERVKSPHLTAEWEEKLLRIERGELSPESFLSEITAMLQELVGTYERAEAADALFPSPHKVIGPCPRCNGHIVEKRKGFFCDNAACGLAFWKNNSFFAVQKKEVTAAFMTHPAQRRASADEGPEITENRQAV